MTAGEHINDGGSGIDDLFHISRIVVRVSLRDEGDKIALSRPLADCVVEMALIEFAVMDRRTPFNRPGILVVLANVAHQLALQFLYRGEDASRNHVALDARESVLHLI